MPKDCSHGFDRKIRFVVKSKFATLKKIKSIEIKQDYIESAEELPYLHLFEMITSTLIYVY